MHVKRFQETKPYDAPNHRNVVSLRLQGFEPDGPKNQWVGLSQYLPGGGAGPDSTPFEKIYIVLDGEITVTVNGQDTVLKKYDSCVIAPNEVRTLENRRNDNCTLLAVIPYPPGVKP